MARSPVDEPPGRDGYQGRPKGETPPKVPEYEPYMNPPGTNPPVEPAQDPAKTPVPGSIPGIEREQEENVAKAADPPKADPPANKGRH